MTSLHPSLLEGRIAPNLPQYSQDNKDWYNEQVRRSFEGHSYVGQSGVRQDLTPDHYYFLNFFQMQVALVNKKGKATNNFDTRYPYYSQDDDYLFKQIEEARLDKKAVMLMTGRGFGKTYMVLSIGQKLWWWKKNAHCVISASGDNHANETWIKLQAGIVALNRAHPSIRRNLLNSNDTEIRAGKILYHPEKDIVTRALFEKIVYDKKAGKSKGRRLDFQHFEEVGDWGGAASLKECIGASEGSWLVNSDIMRARVFYTGTGGTVLSNQAKEIFWNPDAYNIYKVRQWKDRPSAIFIPATKKFGDTWIATGISDEIEAERRIDEKRAAKESDPEALRIYTQEFPKNPDECFQIKGGNSFDQIKLGNQMTRITILKDHNFGDDENQKILQPENGFLHPIYNKLTGQVIGVEWEKASNGPIRIYEHPQKSESGEHFKNLYVGGYDGINLGTEDTKDGTGSQGALVIKKRMNPELRLSARSNLYVLLYNERPKDIDTLYLNVMLAAMYYGITNLNIEFAPAGMGIVPFFKTHKQDFRFMKRPRVTFSDSTSDEETNLIGTVPTPRNIGYGIDFLARYIKTDSFQLFDVEQVQQFIDFLYEDKTKYDIAMATIHCELADYDMHDKSVKAPPPAKDKNALKWGYYTEWVNGKAVKRCGYIPKDRPAYPLYHPQPALVDYYDQRTNTVVYTK